MIWFSHNHFYKINVFTNNKNEETNNLYSSTNKFQIDKDNNLQSSSLFEKIRTITAESYKNHNKDLLTSNELTDNEIIIETYIKSLLSNKRSNKINDSNTDLRNKMLKIQDRCDKNEKYDDEKKSKHYLFNDLKFKFDNSNNSITHYKGSCLKFKKL